MSNRAKVQTKLDNAVRYAKKHSEEQLKANLIFACEQIFRDCDIIVVPRLADSTADFTGIDPMRKNVAHFNVIAGKVGQFCIGREGDKQGTIASNFSFWHGIAKDGSKMQDDAAREHIAEFAAAGGGYTICIVPKGE